MKIVINEIGEVQEVSEKIASRLINKGKAHPVQLGGIVREVPKLNDDLIIPPETKKKLKEFSTELKTGEAISESLEGVEIKIGEIGELAEPIKKSRKSRKKKSKFKNWKIDESNSK